MKREKHCKCLFHMYHGCYWFGKVFEWSVIYWHFIKQHQSDTLPKRVFKKFAKFTRDHLYRSLFFQQSCRLHCKWKRDWITKVFEEYLFYETPSVDSVYIQQIISDYPVKYAKFYKHFLVVLLFFKKECPIIYTLWGKD